MAVAFGCGRARPDHHAPGHKHNYFRVGAQGRSSARTRWSTAAGLGTPRSAGGSARWGTRRATRPAGSVPVAGCQSAAVGPSGAGVLGRAAGMPYVQHDARVVDGPARSRQLGRELLQRLRRHKRDGRKRRLPADEARDQACDGLDNNPGRRWVSGAGAVAGLKGRHVHERVHGANKRIETQRPLVGGRDCGRRRERNQSVGGPSGGARARGGADRWLARYQRM